MLKELYVENFGLIDKSVIDFRSGLNVLTGETGAGKSLIIDAVGLLIGGRGSQDLIRRGADKLIIQGLFEGGFTEEIKAAFFEAGFTIEDNSLILTREISRSGKNVCRINCRIVPLSFLKDVGKKLINIHGQHEHVNILEDETQLFLLDNFGGQKNIELLDKVREAYITIKKIKKQMEELETKADNAAKREDYLKFQIKEIEEAELQAEEDVSLEKERKILLNSEKILSQSKLAYEKLYGGREAGAWDLIRQAVHLLKDVSYMDENAEGIFQKLNEVNFILEDVVREIGDYAANISSDPYRLDEIEQRIVLINKLKKKYGSKIEEIKEYYHKAKEEFKELANQDKNIKELAVSLERAEEEYNLYGDHLSLLRKKAGEDLSKEVTKELHQLHMITAQFSVLLTDSSFGFNGKENVNFLVSPNFGEEMKPVAKIASGGELSRIMLGIKVILSKLDGIPTLIFDEIDSGLGGKAINDVGKKLKTVSMSCQVISVTHSPVIAAFADHHLKIYKETTGLRTVTRIEGLDNEHVVLELGRMLAGDNVSEITLSQARELLKIGHANSQ